MYDRQGCKTSEVCSKTVQSLPDLRTAESVLPQIQIVQNMPEEPGPQGQYPGYGQIELVGDSSDEYD